jgi:hypothetical protein
MSVDASEIVVIFEASPPPVVVEFEDPPDINVVFSEVGLVGPVGPPGPRGLPGAAGDGLSYFEHDQTAPASTWIINHGLGFYREPTVILDSQPNRPVWADVVHGTVNQTTITFPSPETGKATF